MGQKWIIDVIADLRDFADLNALPLLASQLEVTASVAKAEIETRSGGAAPLPTLPSRQRSRAMKDLG